MESKPEPIPLRVLVRAGEDAKDALTSYASLLAIWESADLEHARIQIRGLADEVIAAELADE